MSHVDEMHVQVGGWDHVAAPTPAGGHRGSRSRPVPLRASPQFARMCPLKPSRKRSSPGFQTPRLFSVMGSPPQTLAGRLCKTPLPMEGT